MTNKRNGHSPHFPPRKILVPLDLSEASLSGWEQAKVLAKKFGAEVEGLYVQEWLYSMMGLGMGEPFLTAHASEEALKALRDKLGPDARLRTASGGVEETILSWEKDPGYDLVIMGTHGRAGMERLLKGSIAEAVVRHSEIPVWVSRQAPAEIHSVLAPINLESHALEGLRAAARIAAAFRARLQVLHVMETPLYAEEGGLKARRHIVAQAIERLPAELRDACRPKIQLALGNPVEGIISAAEEADLVVLAAHRRGLLSDTVLGTTAERVMRHCSKPVLALPTGLTTTRRSTAQPESRRSTRA